VALVPLAPDQTLDDLPAITAAADDAGATWLLPTDAGLLRWRTTAAGCRVLP